MTNPFLEQPRETYFVDAGTARTSVPPLPYYVFDGGLAAGVSNPSLDGGSAFNVPFIVDGGNA